MSALANKLMSTKAMGGNCEETFSMTSEDFMTLAYTKSPKTSRRTTFQDELKAAVSARANKPKTDHSSYSDDFNEDEDDFLNKLLKSRKKKTSALRAEKSKTKINDFELSDDESKHSRTKRVSFLKTQRISSSSSDTTASHEKESLDQPASQNNDHEDSWFSQLSTPASEGDVPSKSSNVEFSDSQISRQSSSRSLSYQTSGDTLLDMPLPLPSDNSGTVTPEKKSSSPQTVRFPAAELKYASSADSTTEREPPRPKPRQRTLGLNVQVTEKIAEDAEPEALSGAQTSSASIPVSTDTDGTATWTDKEHTVSRSFSKSSSSKSDLSQLMTKSTVDSGSRKSLFSDDSKEEERKYSTSFEELNDSEDHSDQPSHVQEKASDGRTPSSDSKTTQRSQSACSKKVESKYLGSLKVLDRRVSLQESQPQEAASMRAAVYQEWLKKKKEKSRENMQLKKKEATLEEKKKMEEEAKKGDAVASYQAWKERKANSLRAKAKEKQETIRKEQKATEEKEEKRQSAKQVFEKWKQEHDHLLKEKHRKQREAEKKQKLKTQEKEEERKRDSKSAFNNWNEKKKDVLHEKTVKERKEIRTKAEEEHYMKEERDSMASEMYENWLVRKDLEQRRKKEERRIQEILRDSPPPPWSPPNKTIPFRK